MVLEGAADVCLLHHHRQHKGMRWRSRQENALSDVISPTVLHVGQFCHLTVVCSYFESISSLNYSQISCHDLISSANTLKHIQSFLNPVKFTVMTNHISACMLSLLVFLFSLSSYEFSIIFSTYKRFLKNASRLYSIQSPSI